MVALGGAKDGFFEKFRTVVDGAGLADAWPTIKPYLSEIGDKVSGAASTATFSILQTLAERFPQDSVWVTGLTADRIESMTEVLKGKGLPNDLIQNDIQKVAQAAGNSPTEDEGADAADTSSYHDGGSLSVKVNSENRMVLYDDSTGRTQRIKATFLQSQVPGFDTTNPNFLQIHYQQEGGIVTAYHYPCAAHARGLYKADAAP